VNRKSDTSTAERLVEAGGRGRRGAPGPREFTRSPCQGIPILVLAVAGLFAAAGAATAEWLARAEVRVP
jgi:hypothetical protein